MSTRKKHHRVVDAAKMIGITPGRLRQKIRAGECKAVKFHDERFPSGYSYEVPESEIKRLSQQEQTVGRPRVGTS